MRASAWLIAPWLLVVSVELPGDEMFSESVRVELVDGELIEGRRVEVGRGAVVVDSRRVSHERIVRWDRQAGGLGNGGKPPPAGDEVLLVGGDRLRCQVQRIDLEHLVAGWKGLSQPVVFRIPLERVRAVIFSPRIPGRLLRRLDIDRGGRSADELLLRGGDRLLGELKSVSDKVLVLATEAGDRRVARRSVAVLLVNPELQVKAKRPSRHVRVAFSDGSRLTSGWPTAGGGRLIRLSLEGIELVTGDLAGMARVDVSMREIRSVQYFGGKMLRLTRREPEQSVHTPFIGAVRPPVIDGSIGGGPLEVAGRWSASGLGMTSRTRMTWVLDGRHRWFCARVAIDDTAGNGGDVVFRVLVDGRPAWSSGPVQGGHRPRTLGPVDLAGARKLTLVVDYGRRADVGDHAVWLDPRLVAE